MIFPVKIQKIQTDKKNEEIQLDYLVCKDICIPYSETRILNIDFHKKFTPDIFIKVYKTVPKKIKIISQFLIIIFLSEKISITY